MSRRYVHRLHACWRRWWLLALWAAAPRPSRRQVAHLLLVSLVLSVGLLRILGRPYPDLAPLTAWDDYYILTELDKDHTVADALGYFVGDWPEKNGFYRPLTGVSLWVDYRLWHWQPYGYRLTNAIIYVLTGAALALFIAFLGDKRRYAVAALAFFMLLPQQGSQGAVSVLNTRGDLLCGLFALLALYAALRFITDSGARWLAAALLGLGCALLSKEMGLALPLLLLLCVIPVVVRRPARLPRLALRTALVGVLWALVVLTWIYLYRAFVGGRMPLPGEPLPPPIGSTTLLAAGALLPDFTVLVLFLRTDIGWEGVLSHFVRVMFARLALWLAAMVWLARREPWLLMVYLCWTPLAWLPLRTTHVCSTHYLYLPQMSRYLALGVLSVLLYEALKQRAQPERWLGLAKAWCAQVRPARPCGGSRTDTPHTPRASRPRPPC